MIAKSVRSSLTPEKVRSVSFSLVMVTLQVLNFFAIVYFERFCMQARVGPSSFIFKFGMPTSTHLSSEPWCLRELQFPLVSSVFSRLFVFA